MREVVPLPVGKKEIYQHYLCTKSAGSGLPPPISNLDKYYEYLCNPSDEKFKTLPPPIGKENTYLYYLCANGLIGTGQRLSIDSLKVVDSVPADAQIGEIYAVRKGV